MWSTVIKSKNSSASQLFTLQAKQPAPLGWGHHGPLCLLWSLLKKRGCTLFTIIYCIGKKIIMCVKKLRFIYRFPYAQLAHAILKCGYIFELVETTYSDGSVKYIAASCCEQKKTETKKQRWLRGKNKVFWKVNFMRANEIWTIIKWCAHLHRFLEQQSDGWIKPGSKSLLYLIHILFNYQKKEKKNSRCIFKDELFYKSSYE